MLTIEVIIKTITEWPVIIQGALGSALFAFISYIGNKMIKHLYFIWNKYSKENAEILDSHKQGLIEAHLERDFVELNNVMTVMIFCSLHYLMKATLFVSLGYMAESFIPIFGVVGYFIGFTFLFKAMTYSPHLKFLGKSDDELQDIKINLAKKHS